MTITNIAAYCVALFIMVAIPGPGVMSLVGNSLGSGFMATVPMALGLIAGDLTFMTAVVLGLSVVLGGFAGGFLVLKAASAIYILYLAWKLASRAFNFEGLDAAPRIAPKQAFLTGYLVTMGNPKCMIFYISLLPTLLPLSKVTLQDYLVIAALTAVILAATVAPYMLLAARIGAAAGQPRDYRVVRWTAAAIMAAAALMVLWQLVAGHL